MADIIDAFVVTLGLDPKQYNDEIKKYRDDQKRLRNEHATANREQQDAQKKIAAGFRTVRNELAGLFVLISGSASLTGFVKDVLTGAAATGRFAQNVGMATESVSVWENLITRVGGKAADARNILGTLSAAFQSLQLTGTTGKDADFQGLGVTAKDLQDPENALLKIADAGSRIPRAEFTERLNRIGFSPEMITLLAKGRVEVTRLMEEQRKLGVTTDADAEAAQKLEARMAALESGIRAKALPIISELADRFATWLGDQDNMNDVLETTALIFKGMGLAAGAVVDVVEALAGAFRDLRDSYMGLPSGVRDFFENLGAMATGGDYKNAYDYIGDAVGGEAGARFKAAFGSEGKGTNEPSNEPGGTPGRSGGGGRGFGTSTIDAMSAAAGLPGGAGGSGARTAAAVERYFRAKGYTAAQAKGIAAGVVAEGGLTRRTGGGYKGRALGIGQLLGGRRAEFLKKYGPNFTFQNELDFMNYELNGGDRGGAAVKAQTSAQGTLRAMITQFYRPASGAETMGDLARGSAYLGGARVGLTARGSNVSTSNSQSTTVGQVIVYSAATDAAGIARDMRGALAQRGLVTQANTGLQP